MGKIGVDVSPVDPNVVWAIVEAEDGGVYRSEDAGKTWRRTSEDRLIRARAWYYTEVYADPWDRETVYVLNAPLTRSIDGGRTFQEIQVPHGDTHDLWINPDDSRVMILADDGGATITLNGGRTWSTQENQPTSQFYRVNTDNRFPYWVYGGQQDNSSVAIMSRNPAGFGIGWKNWFEAAGCESAYLAFNPDDPRYLYGGCYQGSIAEMDTRTGYQRDIMAYPSQNLAVDPRSQKYRFNWNAPLIVSKHDPSVIYHASNVLLRSSDRGNTWTEVSGDLTRNEKEKQGAGGAPITNEGAGGEIYNTIFYVAESPVQAGVLWAGSDDGLIHLTRDGGRTWENMTPRGHSEARINSIEASPHDAGTAYVAIALDKLNDYTPLIFRTRDWGKTWVRISNGIAPEAWARVVREDPVRKGLLYAGTETGVYVSWDDGERWQPLQLNLPVVPVTDLKIQGNDLVASTSGRSFWILDDITLLRRVGAGLIPPLQDGRTAGTAVSVVVPEKVYRLPAPGFILEVPRIGPNPPGAVFHVWLRTAPDTAKAVKVEVLDAGGTVIRTMTTRREKGPDGKLMPADSIALKQGMNRVSWNVRHQGYESIPGLFSLGAAGAGRMVLPGRYAVRVTSGTEQATAALEVIPDPRHEYPAASYAEQDAMAKTLQGHLADLYSYVRKLRAAKEQTVAAVKRAEGSAGATEVKTAGDSLSKRLEAAENRLVQPRAKTFQDVINYENQLDAQLLTLFGSVDGAEPPLTAGQRQRVRDLEAQWAQEKATLDRLLGAEIEAFNRLIREKGVPAVVPLPRSIPSPPGLKRT